MKIYLPFSKKNENIFVISIIQYKIKIIITFSRRKKKIQVTKCRQFTSHPKVITQHIIYHANNLICNHLRHLPLTFFILHNRQLFIDSKLFIQYTLIKLYNPWIFSIHSNNSNPFTNNSILKRYMIQFIQFYQLGDCTITMNEHATRLCFVYGEYDKNIS